MRGTAVVLRKKYAVVRHDICKYAIMHTSNRNKSFDAQGNAKHQSSNIMTKGLVSRITVVLIHVRISAAQRIPGICEEQRNALV